jgi:hypothetical protein
MPEKKNIKRGKISFGSQFRGFSPWFTGSTALGLRKGRVSRRRECVVKRLLASWQPGSRE